MRPCYDVEAPYLSPFACSTLRRTQRRHEDNAVTPSRPRIVFYTENTVVGGSERYLHDLAGSLIDQHVDVRLGCNPDPSLLAYLRSIRAGVCVDALPVHMLSRSAAFQLGQQTGAGRAPRLRWFKLLGGAVVRLAQFGLNVALLRRWLMEQRPDILHINNGGYPAAESCRAAAVAGRLAGVPVVGMAVHSMAEPRRWPHAQEAGLDRLVSRSLDTLITASMASADTLIRRRGFPRRQIIRIPYGIDVPPLRSNQAARRLLGLPEESLLVGMVGRLVPGKGHEYLLEAAALALGELQGVRLVVVGTGPAEAEYRALAQRLGIGNHTIFTGRIDDVYEAMAAFDVCAMPSVGYESLPYTLLEAMGVGLPIVATRVAGIPEAIEDGRTGVLVAPRDAEGLASSLLWLLRNPEERQRLGLAARARARSEYSLSRMVERTRDHYTGLLGIASGR